MQKRVRCPLCGMVVWRSQVEKPHNIDILAQKRYVRAKGSGGFKFTRSEDVGLVALVKSKIKALYDRYFPSIKIAPRILTAPRVFVRAPRPLNPGVLIMPEVRVE